MGWMGLEQRLAEAIEAGDVLAVGYVAGQALSMLEEQRQRAKANERLADAMAEAISTGTVCTCLFGQKCGKCSALHLYEVRDGC